MEKKVTTNKMGTEPIHKVMLSMGIPIIISMVLQACYNIVDSMFVARISDSNGIVHAGEYAVNALTLAFPIQMLIVAFGIGTGVGVNALLSKTLGENNKERVAKIAGNSATLGIIIYAVFFIFGLFGINIYLKSQTSNEIILTMGKEYLTICTLLSFGIIFFSIYEKLLQATGKSLYSTIAQISGAVVNIVLDPILIFGMLGLPKMGVAGAAYATVIGQVVSMVTAMIFHFKKNKEVKNGFKYMKLDKKIVKEIYSIGVPAIIMQALMSFMTYGINIIFGMVSVALVTSYGIFYKIQQFMLFAGFGLRDAITPIVSFNFGMGDKKRVKQGIKIGIIYVTILMFMGTVGLQIFAVPLINVFGLSKATADLTVLAIRIVSLSFILIGISTAIQGVFQALGCGISTMIISLLRLLIVPMPLAYLFTKLPNATENIWWIFPISEVVAIVAGILLIVRANKRIIKKM